MIINDDHLEAHTMYPSGQAFCIRGFESRHCVFLCKDEKSMCYCTPSIRTPRCSRIDCIPHDIHEGCRNHIQALEEQIKRLMILLNDIDALKSPPPLIACKDCPKIDYKILRAGYINE